MQYIFETTTQYCLFSQNWVVAYWLFNWATLSPVRHPRPQKLQGPRISGAEEASWQLSWWTLQLIRKPHGSSMFDWLQIPSGKRLHNDGKSPFLVGKSIISIRHFHPFSICRITRRYSRKKSLVVHRPTKSTPILRLVTALPPPQRTATSSSCLRAMTWDETGDIICWWL